MATGGTLRYDSTRPETWPSFLRRIKNHVASKGAISDSQKRGILLDALDDATLDRLDRWLEPLTTDTSGYEHVLESLVNNMGTPVNPTAQYIRFVERRQQAGESVLAYHEALSVLVATIGFDSRPVRDALVMHQFIAGLADEALQHRILDLDDCTPGKALDTAAQHEATRRSAAVLRSDSADAVFWTAGRLKCFYCAGPHKAKDCTSDRSLLYCKKCKGDGHVAEVCQGGARAKRGKGGCSGACSTPSKAVVVEPATKDAGVGPDAVNLVDSAPTLDAMTLRGLPPCLYDEDGLW